MQALRGLEHFFDVARVGGGKRENVGGADHVAYYLSIFWVGRIGVVHQDEAGLRGESGELETPDVGRHAGGDGVGREGWGEGCDALEWQGAGVSNLLFEICCRQGVHWLVNVPY